jgi:proline iminopeptidase
MIELSDGCTLWTESSVVPGGAGMVFLHGGPGMWDYLAPVAEMVADTVSTHRYDQRGCGRSSAVGTYSIEQFTADLDELRAYFGYERWLVFGHSFGASLALSYAANYPSRVSGLIYCSGTGMHWQRHRVRYHERARARLTDQQAARRDLLEVRNRTWAEEVEWRTLCWLPDFADPERAWALASRDAEFPYPINFECHAALTGPRHPTDKAPQQINAPTLLIHGSEDPRPLDGVEALAETIPHSRLAVIPGAGHQPWHEQPAQLRSLLHEFIADHSGDRQRN